MGLAVAVSNSTIANWLKETITLANIRASGWSTRKAAVTFAARLGASVKTIIGADDWAHTSMMYGHYIRYLPRGVLVRILEQTSASILGVNEIYSYRQYKLGWYQPYEIFFCQEDVGTNRQIILLLGWMEHIDLYQNVYFSHLVGNLTVHSVIWVYSQH